MPLERRPAEVLLPVGGHTAGIRLGDTPNVLVCLHKSPAEPGDRIL